MSNLHDYYSALEEHLLPLRPVLDDPRVTDVCIQEPHLMHVERVESGWERVECDWLDELWCAGLASLCANYNDQGVDAQSPLLSASLPSGERIQFVLPPACKPHIAISIRCPSRVVWPLEELAERGTFDHVRLLPEDRIAGRDEVLGLLIDAIDRKLAMLFSGKTGSGKTALTKAMVRRIPSHVRLICIENVRELDTSHLPNAVRLFYSAGGQGVARAKPSDLLTSCKRMRPDGIAYAELLTGEDVFEFSLSINSGHSYAFASLHANSCALIPYALAQMLLHSETGRNMTLEAAAAFVMRNVDMTIQCDRDGAGRRHVSEIWRRSA